MTLTLHGTNGVTYPNGDTQVGATKVLQIKRDTYTTQSTFSTGFPADDTVPQITEGDQIFSIAMTAGHANNILHFNFDGAWYAGSTQGVAVALFNGASSAIWAKMYRHAQSPPYVWSLVAGTTDAKTYTFRIGDSSGNNCTTNTSSHYGAGTPGQEVMTLTIMEIEV
jgi:hypothetical protein